MKAGTNYLGIQTHEQLVAAIRMASEWHEVPPGCITEHEVFQMLDDLCARRDLEHAEALINGNDLDDETTA